MPGGVLGAGRERDCRGPQRRRAQARDPLARRRQAVRREVSPPAYSQHETGCTIRPVEVKLGRRVVSSVPGDDLVSPRPGGMDVSDLVIVAVEVDPWPREEWLAGWNSRGFPMDLEEPGFYHGSLVFSAREDDLERTWEAVKRRVAEANRVYSDEVIAEQERANAARKRAAAEKEKRLSELQSRVDALPD